MSILFRLPITGTFDGLVASTSLPDTATFVKAADGIYDILDANGDPLVNVGEISCAQLLASELFATKALFCTLSHNGGASATVFQALVALPERTTNDPIIASPVRRVDPSVDGYAGTLALAGPGSILVLFSNGTGAQQALIEVTGVNDEQLATAAGELVYADDADSPDYVIPLLIEDIITANGYVQRFVWNGPTVEITNLRLVASNTIAAGDLVVVAAIGGVAVTGGSLSLAVGAVAGTSDSESPSALNVLQAGSLLTLTVSGGGNTAAGRAMVSMRATPVTNA